MATEIKNLKTNLPQQIIDFKTLSKKQKPLYYWGLQHLLLDQIDLLNESEVVYQAKNNKKTKSLIDKYVAAGKDRFSIKAAYIIRDTVKVTGTKSGIPPINFAFFYDDEQKPKTGATRHTMEICEINKVPYFTKKDWEKWI